MLWFVTLERLPMRYTEQQHETTIRAFKDAGLEYTVIEGQSLTDEITVGSFLDSNSTSFYKATQIQQIAKLFHENKIKNNDIFYFSDIWFPGVSSIPYMSFFNGIKTKIFGILHAGSFTPTDYVNQLKYWAKPFEFSILKMSDGIFLGSEQTRQDIIKTFKIQYPELEKLHVTGLAFDSTRLEKYQVPFEEKEDIIIFPHRLDKEKQPALFDSLKTFFPDCEFIKTHEKKLPKDQYYELLGKSKVLFSASLQENFGYSVLEAITLGVTPILPMNNTCYKYIYPKEVLYENFEDAINKIKSVLKSPIYLDDIPIKYNDSLNRQVQIIKSVIDKNY